MKKKKPTPAVFRSWYPPLPRVYRETDIGCFDCLYHRESRTLFYSVIKEGYQYPWYYAVYIPRGTVMTEEEVAEMGNKLLSRAKTASKAGHSLKSVLTAQFIKSYPIVSAFMSETVDAEDRKRDPSKVTIFLDQGAVKASLSDPSNRQAVYVTLKAIDGVWEALEAALGHDEPDWRSWGEDRKKK